ncbi:MAG: sugar nucleotide-binding protein [Clostridia bacterium]|nr:sugar nucleotide-binding protein [Clostridia bacterium]
MKKALVGYTGFVGSNIYAAGGYDGAYNSKNIEQAFGTKPDLLIYSGLRAEKYLANSDPERDLKMIENAEENIRKIDPKRLVLISSVDVFKDPNGKDEDSELDTEGLQPYGKNRCFFERWTRENYPDALIVRLPGLFGKNIKKNFIYDMINYIPFMLKADKFAELSEKEPILKDYYQLQDNGFYKAFVPDEDKKMLKSAFEGLGFSALNFTDSRSRYQFYDLRRLNGDIDIALKNNLTMWHPATEPVSAGEVFRYITGKEFVNELNGDPVNYDFRTKYAELFGGKDGYLCGKEEILRSIKAFVEGMR